MRTMTVAKDLRETVSGIDRRYRAQRYPQELRERLIEAARSGRKAGESWAALSRMLGVGSDTLRRWCSAPEAGGNVVRLARVGVAASGGVRVVAPSGWRVEGLCVADAARLLGELA